MERALAESVSRDAPALVVLVGLEVGVGAVHGVCPFVGGDRCDRLMRNYHRFGDVQLARFGVLMGGRLCL